MFLHKHPEVPKGQFKDVSLSSQPSSRSYSVELFVFRGVRSIYNTKLSHVSKETKDYVDHQCDKDPRFYTGHVGISIDHGKHIYGWNPLLPPTNVLSLQQALQRLKEGATFPGILTDDTIVFQKASNFYKKNGWDTRVIQIQIASFTSNNYKEYRRIKHTLYKLHSQPNGEHGWKYSFPKNHHKQHQKTQQQQQLMDTTSITSTSKATETYFDPFTANCATFPKVVLGLNIPHDSGKMDQYVKHAK